MNNPGFSRDRIDVSQQDCVTVLKPKGSLCVYGHTALEERIAETMKQGCCRIVLDLSATPMMSSTALGVLLQYTRTLKSRRGRLVLAAPTASLKRILLACNLNRTLRICDTLAEALDAARHNLSSGRLQRVQL